MSVSLPPDGAQRLPGAALSCLGDLCAALADLPSDEAGSRLYGINLSRPLLEPSGCIGKVAASALGPDAHPVRALFLNKTAATNWSLGWHQDRTICVKARHDVEGFGPWTIKQGIHHVAPPFELLARMVTLRVHLDDVGPDNAPLLIAPGSHAVGKIAVNEVANVVERCGTRACLAEAGDIWLYSTPILHASGAATAPSLRRVLQIDYSAEDLPPPLEWLKV